MGYSLVCYSIQLMTKKITVCCLCLFKHTHTHIELLLLFRDVHIFTSGIKLVGCLPDSHLLLLAYIDLSIFKRVNVNREKRNEAVDVYRPLLFFFSLPLSLSPSSCCRSSQNERRKIKQKEETTGGNQSRWPGDSFEQKIEFTITMS